MQENFEVRIRQISKLKNGWNYGDGTCFDEEHVELAIDIAKRYFNIHGLSVSGTPNIDGSITLIFSKNDNFLEVTLAPNMQSTAIKYFKGITKNQGEEWGTTSINDTNQLDNIFETFTKMFSSTTQNT